MLRITIPATEMFDERTLRFISTKEQTLELEHSLVSLSKWESKWCKAFLSNRAKNYEETVDYIKCMTLTPDVPDEVYSCLTQDNVEQINKYIEAPMTATHFVEDRKGKHNSETITSELIYYWMFSLNIPMECQAWHLNRLLAQIRVGNIKNQPHKKMSKSELMSRNRALNEARKQQLGTKG